MREKIHPAYHDIQVTCSCGNVIETASTMKSVSVAICSKCHPFFTGKQRLVDTAGRVERFNKRYAKKEPAKGGSPEGGSPKKTTH